jgi:ribosomal protein S18 acetylase RimI-like enzyme
MPMKAPTDPPSIRLATLDDVPRIRAIARAAYAKYMPRIGREPAPMAADYEAEVAAQRVVVIDPDAGVSGYMVAWPEADAYFIDNIGIAPNAQGRGLGRQLIEHAAAEAHRLHLPALRLYTNAAMIENLFMYTYLGFVETHRAAEKGFNRIYMRLDLSEKPPSSLRSR